MEELALRIIDGLPATIRRLSLDLTPAALAARPAVDEWSFVEIVGHLIDKTEAWGERFRRISLEELPMLPGFDQDARVRERDYQAQPLADLDSRLDALLAAVAAELRALPPAAWGRAGVHSERGRLTLAEAVRIYAISLPEHVEQLVRTRDAALRAMSAL